MHHPSWETILSFGLFQCLFYNNNNSIILQYRLIKWKRRERRKRKNKNKKAKKEERLLCAMQYAILVCVGVRYRIWYFAFRVFFDLLAFFRFYFLFPFLGHAFQIFKSLKKGLRLTLLSSVCLHTFASGLLHKVKHPNGMWI